MLVLCCVCDNGAGVVVWRCDGAHGAGGSCVWGVKVPVESGVLVWGCESASANSGRHLENVFYDGISQGTMLDLVKCMI